MRKFNSYLTGLAPWITLVAGLGFITRFGVFSNSGVAPHINYLLITGIAAVLYSLVMILHFCGIDLSFLDYKSPEKNTVLNCFDASVVMIVILLLLKRAQEISGLEDAVIMCMISMAISILALISQRTSRLDYSRESISGSGVGGRVLLALVFLAVCGLSVLTFNVAFSGVEKLSDALSVGVKATGGFLFTVLKYILIGIEKFFAWLVDLFPGDVDMPLPPPEDPPVVINGDDIPQIRNGITVPGWVYYVLAAAAIILIIVFIARNISVGGKLVTVNRSKRVKRSKTKRNSAFEKFRAELRYRLCRIRYRRSVPGLLLYCEKHAPKDMKRRKGESGESFLRRMAVSGAPSSVSSPSRVGASNPEILWLAEMVEKHFYAQCERGGAGKAEPVKVSRDEFRRIIKAWDSCAGIRGRA